MPGGRLLKKNLVGAASSSGHCTTSQHAAKGSFPADNLCAGRTRQAANRDDHFPLLPSRHVTLRKSRARPCAHSKTDADGAPACTFSGRDGGRPRPVHGGTSPKSASAAITFKVLSMPTP